MNTAQGHAVDSSTISWGGGGGTRVAGHLEIVFAADAQTVMHKPISGNK